MTAFRSVHTILPMCSSNQCILIDLQVHARAFKLLTKLAGTVMDDEMLLYRLYLEYDASHSGALGLSELSKWVK